MSIADFFKKNAAGFGGVLGAATSGLFNLYSQKQAAKYNEELAAKQNSWNIAQWERTNAYNSPAAQKARLEQAGLNADMMYGNGALQNVATSSPQMSAGSPMSPLDWTSLNPVSSFLDNQLKQAQIDNINADTAKKGGELNILNDTHKLNEALHSGIVELQGLTINMARTDAKYKEPYSQQQLKNMQEEFRVLQATSSELQKRIEHTDKQMENLDADTRLKVAEEACRKALTDAQVAELGAKYGLEKAQAHKIYQELPEFLANLQADTAYKNAQEAESKSRNGLNLEQGAILIKEKESLQIDIDVKKNAHRYQTKDSKFWKSVYDGVDFVGELVSAVSPFIGPAADAMQGPASRTTNNYVNVKN